MPKDDSDTAGTVQGVLHFDIRITPTGPFSAAAACMGQAEGNPLPVSADAEMPGALSAMQLSQVISFVRTDGSFGPWHVD